MSVQLLDKTRKIGKLLHNNNSSKVVFNDICQVLTEILDSSILVISKKGKVLGISHSEDTQEITELIVDEVGGFTPPSCGRPISPRPQSCQGRHICDTFGSLSFHAPIRVLECMNVEGLAH